MHLQAATDEQLSRLFRTFPGMEYCDLKRDRATGRSKGYAYVNYSTPEAAGAAQAQLNGIEFPLGSGYRLKVVLLVLHDCHASHVPALHAMQGTNI
jgi:RNA recognition motif-containing protein